MKKYLAHNILSLVPMVYLHELGHYILAWIYHVPIKEVHLLPGFRGHRFGVGLAIDYSYFPDTFSKALCLMAGCLLTFIIGLIIYHFSKTPWLKTSAYIWTFASVSISSYDFFDIGLLLHGVLLGRIFVMFTYVVMTVGLVGYYKMINNLYDK